MVRNIITIAIVAMSSLVVGCSSGDVEPLSNNVAIEVSQQSFEVADDGATLSLRFSLAEPVVGIDPLPVCDAEWVTDFDIPFDNILSFRVKPNPYSEPRATVVEIRYPGVDTPARVEIRQKASAGEKFLIEVTDNDYSTCAVKITPHNAETHYIVMMAERDYFAEMDINDVESLVESDNRYFYAYVGENHSMADFLKDNGITLQGTQTKRWESLSPVTEYVIYCYGIEASKERFERVTPVSYIEIPKRMPERQQIKFDIDIAVDGVDVALDIVPQDWQGYYMVQLIKDTDEGFIAEGEPRDENFAERVAESFFYLSDNLYYYYEYSIEQIMEELGERGATTYTQTLHANHKYMALLYAIDSIDGNIPMMVSEPVVEYFTTGSVERSDLQFEVNITNIMPRSADIEIIPSNNEESYSAVVMYANRLPEGDNDTQLDYIMENYSPFEISGYYFESVVGLQPDNEFIVAIYGIYGGSPTTDLFIYRFRTNAEGEGTNRITDVAFTAYDLQEVVAIEDYYTMLVGYGEYLLSMEVTTERPTHRVHFSLYVAAQVEEFGLEAVRADLLDYSYTSMFDWALCNYDTEYIICGLAEDEEGNVGEMYVSEPITIRRGETGDAKEFVERYADYTD